MCALMKECTLHMINVRECDVTNFNGFPVKQLAKWVARIEMAV